MKNIIFRLAIALFVFSNVEAKAQTAYKDSVILWSGTTVPIPPAIAYSRWTSYVNATPSVDQLTFRNVATGIPGVALASSLPISTDTQTALDAKQATLIAGTNISIVGTTISATTASFSFNNTPSVTIQTVAASANGNQLSSTRNAQVSYSVTLVSTATIAGSQSGYVVLEICPTNSAVAGNWVEINRVTNGQAVSLAVVLQSVSTGGGTVSGTVPSGYYRRLRSVNVSGTPSYTFNSGQEVLL